MLHRNWVLAFITLSVTLLSLLEFQRSGAQPACAAPLLEETPTATVTPACGVPPAWQPGPTRDPTRAFFQGTTADDGKFYMAGGQFHLGQVVYANVDRFNPVTNAWEALAPLPVPVGQASVGATNGKLLVAGGCAICDYPNNAVTTTLQILDLASGTWSLGAPLPAGVEDAAGAALDGRFYVMGGDNIINSQRTTYIYDLAANTWTTGALLPDPAGRTNTYGTTASNLIYVYGGASLVNGNPTAVYDTLITYNPRTNTWTQLASAKAGGGGWGLGLSPYGPGRLIATGGRNASDTETAATYIYNIATNTFSSGPPMLIPHAGHAQGTLPDGRVIIYGGVSSGHFGTTTSELLGPVQPCVVPTPIPDPAPATPVAPRPTTTPAVVAGPSLPTTGLRANTAVLVVAICATLALLLAVGLLRRGAAGR
jgi:Galactose oxidase, central domain/Kelch motif